MKQACDFYERLGFKATYGGADADFTSFKVGTQAHINLVVRGMNFSTSHFSMMLLDANIATAKLYRASPLLILDRVQRQHLSRRNPISACCYLITQQFNSIYRPL
jgi:hypothetical protein